MSFVLAHVTQNIVYGITLPYLPILLRNLGYRAAVVGVLLALAQGAGILGPFLFSRFADRDGRYKSYIILAYFLAAASAPVLVFFSHPAITAVLIVLFAVGFRSVLPLIDAMTTINLGEKGNYGKIRVGGSISYVCFVLFLQWVPVMRPNTPGNIAFWICVTSVLALIVTLSLPARYENRRSRSVDFQTGVSGGETKKSIWTPMFIVGLTSIALSRLAMTPVESFLPLFLVEDMRWDAVGLMFGLSAISEIPLVYFSNRIIRRFGSMPIIAFACVMVAVRLTLYVVFPFRAGVIIAQLLHSFCFGLFHPAAVAFISNCVPPEKRSFGMTLYMSVGWGIPMLIGNFIGGFIVDYAGYRSLFASFTVFAILGAVIYVVYRFRESFIKTEGRI